MLQLLLEAGEHPSIFGTNKCKQTSTNVIVMIHYVGYCE